MHPALDGRPNYRDVIPCPEAGCLQDAIRGFKSGDPYAVSRGVTKPQEVFANFQKIPGARGAFKFAKEFAEGGTEWMWLLIYGHTGCGKSYLCNAIVNRLIERGREVRLLTCPELLAKLKQGFANNTTALMLQEFKDIFVLVIDDLGIEQGSSWEEATLEDLLTSRHAIGMPTVATTNLDISQLSPRIRSRFQDKHYSRAVHNSAPDYRLTKR